MRIDVCFNDSNSIFIWCQDMTQMSHEPRQENSNFSWTYFVSSSQTNPNFYELQLILAIGIFFVLQYDINRNSRRLIAAPSIVITSHLTELSLVSVCLHPHMNRSQLYLRYLPQNDFVRSIKWNNLCLLELAKVNQVQASWTLNTKESNEIGSE